MTSSGGATKGKSLGKKGAATSIRDKCKSNLKHTKSTFKEVNNYPSKKLDKYEAPEETQEEQNYYEESWEKEEP
jgi:hypothetical protein